MKKFFITMLTCVFMLGMSGLSNALVMDFDDISFSNVTNVYNGHYGVLENYQGFSFHNAGVIETDEIVEMTGFQNADISPYNVLMNWNALEMTISSPDIFELNSAYFTAAWKDWMYIQVKGFLDNNFIYYSSFIVNTQIPYFAEFDWIGINTVTISSYGGITHPNYNGSEYHVAIDDIVYNETQTAPVPEPATILLMGTGLLGIAGYQKRKLFSNKKGVNKNE